MTSSADRKKNGEQEWDDNARRRLTKEHLVWLAREREAKEKEYERELEMAQKQFDKDYEAAEKEHGKFLEAEAFQEALKPKPIPQHIRFEHTHILGPVRVGKTSLIQQLILEDIRTLDPLPAYVVIDPKGIDGRAAIEARRTQRPHHLH